MKVRKDRPGSATAVTMSGPLLSRRTYCAAALGSAAATWVGSSSGKSPGFSSAGLARAEAAVRSHVERDAVAGVVTLLSRGDETHVMTLGVQDVQSRVPMRRDTIFRIASMQKPISAAAAMMLVEEGKLRLDEPVDRWLPELAKRRVLRRIDSPLDDTVPAKRAITLRDLLTLRPGIGAIMEPPGKYPIQQALADAELAPSANLFSKPPDEFMKRLGSLPLVHQPGERWMYHTGLDILGVLIARATDMTLGQFLEQRMFAPLGMRDTAFYVPAAKIGRLATCYRTDPATGRLAVWDEAVGGRFSRPPAFEAGGGGLVSTADDFHAFARMMLNRGRVGGSRILSRDSVAAMTTDQITPAQKAASPFYPGFWDHHGWGFGLSMITKPDKISKTPGRYGWDGGYGTTYVADPRMDLVAILLAQRVMTSPEDVVINEEFLKESYQAAAAAASR